VSTAELDMKRFIDYDLKQWMDNPQRQPMILHGARQVGKTHAVRELGKKFEDFIEINFEEQLVYRSFFEEDIRPESILKKLSYYLQKPIIPGKTLLFLDEIQSAPRALLSLRYFYEQLPTLHVIAAGSLIDFVIQQLGMPVGRTTSMYMYPMTFIEFLMALGHNLVIEEIFEHDPNQPMSEGIHKKLISLLGNYLAIGGMPAAIKCWRDTQNPIECLYIHKNLVEAYRADFRKYSKNLQLKYVHALFDAVPLQMGKNFKFTSIPGQYRKRELAPCLELLNTAGVVHNVLRTSANGIPLGAGVDFDHFKTIFVDIALAQALLNIDMTPWFLNPLEEIINKGSFVEAFVGQELLGYSNSQQRAQLYYWHRMKEGSDAEVDYVIQDQENIVPIEVKSGTSFSELKSMQIFLDLHEKTPYGIRFSPRNYLTHNKMCSYPLYAIVGAVRNFHNLKNKI
jgi:predicted AAA+ superfamily ATPase